MEVTMLTADMLLCHAVGDYVLQSDWMALNKTKNTKAALLHALTYTLPFLFLTQNPLALLIIGGTHFCIDRWRLARYVVWVKNWIGLPTEFTVKVETGKTIDAEGRETITYTDTKYYMINPPFKYCSATGFAPDRPSFLAMWLLIITDNIMHNLINGLTLTYIR